jgi:DNA-directed RNA polymerase beta subunit
MFRELTTALYAGVDSKNVSKLEEWTKTNPNNIQSKRLLMSFYINEKNNKKAKKVGKELISKSGKAIDYELSASPYILSGDYKEAVRLLEKAYTKSYNEDILIKITTILANYIYDIDGAPKPLLPVEAVLKKRNYYGSLKLRFKMYRNGKREDEQEISINSIPVMVKSVKCWLYGMSKDEILQAGSEPLDPGGYFIVNGHKRVLVEGLFSLV